MGAARAPPSLPRPYAPEQLPRACGRPGLAACDRGVQRAHPPTAPTRWPLSQAAIECLNIMFTEETVHQVLGGAPDYVLDAIDNIDTKVGGAG
jgi:hypothetical protein